MKYPNIEVERIRRGQTQSEFAQTYGVSGATYRNWQAGRTTMPADKLTEMADNLGLSTDYLIGR